MAGLAGEAGANDAACKLGSGYVRATVAKVYDGDTVRLADGRDLRLVGIDTPEIDHHGGPSEPFAKAAGRALRAMAGTGDSVLLHYARERRDHYGRTLAHLFLPDGTNVQARLLERGFATALVVPPNVGHLACYEAAESRARRARAGIWSLARYQPVHSKNLDRRASGFRIVTGRVQRVGNSRKNVWLDLPGDVALRIRREDLAHFRDAYSPSDLQGRKVLARGWVHRHKRKRTGKTELRILVRHPAALKVLD